MLEGIAESTVVVKAGLSRGVNLLPTEEEKVDGRDADFLGVKAKSDTEESARSEKVDITPRFEDILRYQLGQGLAPG